MAAALRWSTPPALIPPTRGSTNRSTTGRPSRRPTMSPTDRSPASAAGRGRAPTRSRAARSRLAGGEDPRAGQRPPPGGHPEVESRRHGPQPAPGPDGGARRPDRDQLSGRGPARRRARWPRAVGPGRRRRPGPRCDRRSGRSGACRRSGRPPSKTWTSGRGSARPSAGDQLPGCGQAGDARAHHGHGRHPGHADGGAAPGGAGAEADAAWRTTPARMSRKRGSSLRDGVRAKATPAESATAGRLDVEVVEDLQMVGDESDRADHHRGGPVGRHPTDLAQQVGADPRVGGPPRALPGHAPGEAGHPSRPSRAAMSAADSPTWSGRGRPRPRPAAGGCGR